MKSIWYAHFCRWRWIHARCDYGSRNTCQTEENRERRDERTWREPPKMTTRGNLAASLARAAPCTRARAYSVRWTSSLISETLIQRFCDCYNAQFLCATHCYTQHRSDLYVYLCILYTPKPFSKQHVFQGSSKFHSQSMFSLTYKACPFPWSRCKKWCLGGARVHESGSNNRDVSRNKTQ